MQKNEVETVVKGIFNNLNGSLSSLIGKVAIPENSSLLIGVDGSKRVVLKWMDSSSSIFTRRELIESLKLDNFLFLTNILHHSRVPISKEEISFELAEDLKFNFGSRALA